MMRDMFKGMIKDISRAEVDDAQNTIKHFINEFAGKDDDNVKRFVRAMGFYAHCCLGCWDLNEGIQARKELISSKSAKLDHVRNEFEICKDVVKVLDTEVVREFEMYKKVRDEYPFMEREREEADDALKTFAEHCRVMNFESSKHVKDGRKLRLF